MKKKLEPQAAPLDGSIDPSLTTSIPIGCKNVPLHFHYHSALIAELKAVSSDNARAVRSSVLY